MMCDGMEKGERKRRKGGISFWILYGDCRIIYSIV